jgi:membrane-associated phospholipid phosphatase
MRNGRDLGQYVHVDALHQAYFVAALNLLGNGYPWNKGNPYGQTPEGGSGMPLPPGVEGAEAQVGFGTFGGPHILVLVTELATRALQGVWFHKWFVHRRLRPEEFGGRVHVHLTGIENYPINTQLFRSPALDIIERATGHFLLPLAFSEGSPVHPAYGAGHATVAGACVTILKAVFDGTAEVRNPVVASADGRELEPFVGPALTVEGELNKLASNVSTGRNHAGVHWRSDGFNSLMLGEQIAISVLRDNRRRFAEPFEGFTFRRFNGQTITI